MRHFSHGRFRHLIAFADELDDALRVKLYQNLLHAVASHRVANRPARFEPRQIKRRHGKYDLLTKPRDEAKLELLQAVNRK